METDTKSATEILPETTAMLPLPQRAKESWYTRIPGDVVHNATEDLPEKQRQLIRWFYHYAADTNLSQEEVAKGIGRDWNTVYQVFTGRHQASKNAICAEIATFKKLVEERAGIEHLDFVETRLTQRIWKLCDAARTYQRVVFIFSDSQIGKTINLEEYTRRNTAALKAPTHYVRMPTSGNFHEFLLQMADQLHIAKYTSSHVLKERIFSMIDSRTLLIVDEVHQCFLGTARLPKGTQHLRVIEFIREVFDRCKCGMVMCGTNTFRREMEQGYASGWLAQLSRRRLASLQLPAVPDPEDLRAFSSAYGLENPTGEALEIQNDVIKREALGVWLTLLRMGAGIATKRKEAMTWDHVLRAYDVRRKLEA